MKNEGQEVKSGNSVGNGPDSAFMKTYYSEHDYNPDIVRGRAPESSASWYEELKTSLEKKDGKASKPAAYLAHYIADMTSPYHVNGMPEDMAKSDIDEKIVGEALSLSDKGMVIWYEELKTSLEKKDGKASKPAVDMAIFDLDKKIVGEALPLSDKGMGRVLKNPQDRLVSDFPVGAPVRGLGGKGNTDWSQEYVNWTKIKAEYPQADWFDPWYNDGSYEYEYDLSDYTFGLQTGKGKKVLIEASSTHALWEWYAYNNYSRPEYPETKVQYSNKFKQKKNGDKNTISEFTKSIATETKKIRQNPLLVEAAGESNYNSLPKTSKLGDAYQEAITDVYTVWRASFSALRPEIEFEPGPESDQKKTKIKIENKANEAAQKVEVKLDIKEGKDCIELISKNVVVPDTIEANKFIEINDKWFIKTLSDCPEAKLELTVTGEFKETPDSGKVILTKEVPQIGCPWLKSINPADYALLAADLRDPFAFDGEIVAQANDTGYVLTTSQGLERKNLCFLEVLQKVKILEMREDCSGWLSLYVLVFETPEQAVAYCQEEYKDFGFTEDYQGFTPGYNGLKEPRLEGLGASSIRGHIDQYKNIVARINEIGCVGEIPFGTVAALAEIWLDKVSKIMTSGVNDKTESLNDNLKPSSTSGVSDQPGSLIDNSRPSIIPTAPKQDAEGVISSDTQMSGNSKVPGQTATNDAARTNFDSATQSKNLGSEGSGEPKVDGYPVSSDVSTDKAASAEIIQSNAPKATFIDQICSWIGTWDTNWGSMDVQMSGNSVTGTYPHDQGRIQGTISGNKLIGTWSEAPSYSPPNDAGDLEFVMSDDCSSFSGNWRYGSTGGWSGGWSGTRQ
jgi:hypothetical protein